MNGSEVTHHKHSRSEDKLSDALRNISRDSTHYKSNVSGLPHLISSVFSNYRDKTLSLTKNKRFSIAATKSVFKFRETEKIVGSIKHSTHNIELVSIKNKTQKLQNDISAANIKNSDLVKKLNLIKFISKTRPTNQLMPATNNYFKECEEFTQKFANKKIRLESKLSDLSTRVTNKQEENEMLEVRIKANKLACVKLRAKRDTYATLQKRAYACDEKSKSIKKRLDGDKEVVFATHELTIANERIQLERLQSEIARFILDEMETSGKSQVRRLVFEAREAEMKLRSRQ